MNTPIPTHETGDAQSDWYESALGAFVLPRERHLVQKMLAPWPRRGRSLLEIGCGAGHFLDLFWEAGFDVTGYDSDPDQLAAARARLGGRVETRLGPPNALPFEDDAFDFVAVGPLCLRTRTAHDEPAPIDVLHEAVRVAAGGVLLRCWNPYSLAGMGKTLRGLLPGGRMGLSWARARMLLRECAPPCALSTRSVLHGPVRLWREGMLARVNDAIVRLPAGALLALRATFAPATPLTGLPLGIRPLRMEAPRPAAVMEHRAHRAGRNV